MSRRAHIAVRTCVGCGCRDGQSRMLRLQWLAGVPRPVERPTGGRSAYVHACGECVARLGKSRLLERSLRRRVSSSERMLLIEQLERRVQAGGDAPSIGK